jgi:hypothetical protein
MAGAGVRFSDRSLCLLFSFQGSTDVANATPRVRHQLQSPETDRTRLPVTGPLFHPQRGSLIATPGDSVKEKRGSVRGQIVSCLQGVATFSSGQGSCKCRFFDLAPRRPARGDPTRSPAPTPLQGGKVNV